jgi:hypothetical protein
VTSASSNLFNMLTRDQVVQVLECVGQEFEAATRDLYLREARADLRSEVEVSPNPSMTYVKPDPLMIHNCAILVCNVPRAADMLVPVAVMVSTRA